MLTSSSVRMWMRKEKVGLRDFFFKFFFSVGVCGTLGTLGALGTWDTWLHYLQHLIKVGVHRLAVLCGVHGPTGPVRFCHDLQIL